LSILSVQTPNYTPQTNLQKTITSQAYTSLARASAASPGNSINNIPNATLNLVAQLIIQLLKCFLRANLIAHLKELYTNLEWRHIKSIQFLGAQTAVLTPDHLKERHP
jgi:hypothetical protein